MVPYQDSEARKSNVLEGYSSLAYALEREREFERYFPHICSHAVENHRLLNTSMRQLAFEMKDSRISYIGGNVRDYLGHVVGKN